MITYRCLLDSTATWEYSNVLFFKSVHGGGVSEWRIELGESILCKGRLRSPYAPVHDDGNGNSSREGVRL